MQLPKRTVHPGVAVKMNITEPGEVRILTPTEVIEPAPGGWMLVDLETYAGLLRSAYDAAETPTDRKTRRQQRTKDRRN